MTMYEPTRGGKKKFLRDIKPGKTYYTVSEATQPWGNEPMYTEWVFKTSRLWGFVSGHLSAEGVLANFGPIYDTQPVGMRGVNDKPSRGYNPHDNNGDAYEEHQKAISRRHRVGVR